MEACILVDGKELMRSMNAIDAYYDMFQDVDRYPELIKDRPYTEVMLYLRIRTKPEATAWAEVGRYSADSPESWAELSTFVEKKDRRRLWCKANACRVSWGGRLPSTAILTRWRKHGTTFMRKPLTTTKVS